MTTLSVVKSNLRILLQSELTPLDIVSMKFAPIASVEVERVFRLYKSVLRPNRGAFNFNNLSMYTVSRCSQDPKKGPII